MSANFKKLNQDKKIIHHIANKAIVLNNLGIDLEQIKAFIIENSLDSAIPGGLPSYMINSRVLDEFYNRTGVKI